MPGGAKSARWARGGISTNAANDSEGGGISRHWQAAWGYVKERGESFGASNGSEEEKQGLLSNAEKSLKNVADQAAARLGGSAGAALQVVSIGQETWMLFFLLLGGGCLLMGLAYLSLPLIVLAPQKFAGVFTAGSLCILASLAVLRGPGHFAAHLTSRERLPLSAAYFASIAGTLWASLWYRSSLLTMVLSAVQIVELMWFLVAYIPGGTMVLGHAQSIICGALRKACCGCLAQSRSSSLPL
eukprot:TRINITY_DN28861_c0_g1_i2.p1 TRINITY_DN28861_c0_g1~~TRINITY_DN28861_c0_g1_i2.p1  ORF type:complete len:243 (+),score=43.88 TRINITY_DN28861_c0_g1_i2:142-870(+)